MLSVRLECIIRGLLPLLIFLGVVGVLHLKYEHREFESSIVPMHRPHNSKKKKKTKKLRGLTLITFLKLSYSSDLFTPKSRVHCSNSI